MHRCKGWCDNEEYKGNRVPYHKGYKRCTVCEVNIKTDGFRCYCCGARIRNGSQAGEYRHRRVDLCVRIE